MTCQRCGGWLYKERDEYVCLQCGVRVYDTYPLPYIVPYKRAIHSLPSAKPNGKEPSSAWLDSYAYEQGRTLPVYIPLGWYE